MAETAGRYPSSEINFLSLVSGSRRQGPHTTARELRTERGAGDTGPCCCQEGQTNCPRRARQKSQVSITGNIHSLRQIHKDKDSLRLMSEDESVGRIKVLVRYRCTYSIAQVMAKGMGLSSISTPAEGEVAPSRLLIAVCVGMTHGYSDAQYLI